MNNTNQIGTLQRKEWSQVGGFRRHAHVFAAGLVLALAIRPAAADGNKNNMDIAIISSVLTYAVAGIFGDRPLEKAFRPQIGQRGIGLELGKEFDRSDDLEQYQLTYNWHWRDPVIERESWRMKGAWQLNAGVWDAKGFVNKGNSTIYNAGITPLLRFEPNSRVGGVIPYAEFGIGLQLISETSIGIKQKSTALQFGSNYGFGIAFGEKNEFRAGYRYLHVSNADIKMPNNATDFHNVFFEYRY